MHQVYIGFIFHRLQHKLFLQAINQERARQMYTVPVETV